MRRTAAGIVMLFASMVTAGTASPAAASHGPTHPEGAWLAGLATSFGTANHTATTLPDGTVLTAGGDGSAPSGLRTDVQRYDPTTNTWSTRDSLNVARGRHHAVLLGNGLVLVAGGTSTATAELYVPASDTWSTAS